MTAADRRSPWPRRRRARHGTETRWRRPGPSRANDGHLVANEGGQGRRRQDRRKSVASWRRSSRRLRWLGALPQQQGPNPNPGSCRRPFPFPIIPLFPKGKEIVF